MKIILTIVVSLMLLGCGGSNVSNVSAKTPKYWTEIGSFKKDHNLSTSTVVTYVDDKGKCIVVVYSYESVAVTQIK